MNKAVLTVLLLAMGLTAEPSRMDELLKKELAGQPAAAVEKANQEQAPGQADVDREMEERFFPEKEDSGVMGLLAKMLVSLGILVLFVYYALRYISGSKDARYPVRDIMNVLSSKQIAPGKQLQIVDIGGQLYVLGVSDSAINLVTEITSADVKGRIYQQKESFVPSHDNFLTALLSNVKSLHTAESGEPDVLERMKKRQSERLTKLKKQRDLLGNENPELF